MGAVSDREPYVMHGLQSSFRWERSDPVPSPSTSLGMNSVEGDREPYLIHGLQSSFRWERPPGREPYDARASVVFPVGAVSDREP